MAEPWEIKAAEARAEMAELPDSALASYLAHADVMRNMSVQVPEHFMTKTDTKVRYAEEEYQKRKERGNTKIRDLYYDAGMDLLDKARTVEQPYIRDVPPGERGIDTAHRRFLQNFGPAMPPSFVESVEDAFPSYGENEQTYAYGGPVMPGNIYDRRMFRMANGGMMPPMAAAPPMQPAMPPQGALPPELAAMMGTGGGGAGGMPPQLAAMMGGGGGGQQPITDPSQLPPEVLQAADENLSAATNELLEQELAAASGEEAARSMANVAAAGDITGLLNAVWDDNRTLDEYRSELAAVVGAEDAAQTPDSVLALVQPTLQLAQMDQGVGALMQEELAEMGADPGGITGLAAKSAVADSMAAETGALVNAVGGMSGGQPPMMMEESVDMLAAGPGGMEDVTETMVTGPYA